MELKTTKSSLTFWREDFEKDNKKRLYNIKKNQILGLKKFNNYYGVYGFIFNFRNAQNDTFFVSIENFINYTSLLPKKSININDVFKMNPIKIENKLLRVNYKYNTEKFFTDVFKIYGGKRNEKNEN